MSRHPWDRTIRNRRETTDALARASDAAVIDVGRQHDPLHDRGHGRDDRTRCVACQQNPHDDRSDFCTPCRNARK